MSIGEELAGARQQAGLTITQVSQRTRIRESIVRAIEQGDFSACGGDFYARGHIRSIATAIGIDPAPLVHEYDETHEPPGSISAAEVFEPSKPIRISEPRTFGLGKVMIVGLLAVIGVVTYHLVSTSSPRSTAGAGLASAADRATAKPKAAPAPAAAPARARTAAVSKVAVLEISATENCWTEITRTSGKVLYNSTIQAGSTLRWSERQRVLVQLGNPGGVVLRVDGKRTALHASMPLLLSVTPGHGIRLLSATSAGTGIGAGTATGTSTGTGTGTAASTSTGTGTGTATSTGTATGASASVGAGTPRGTGAGTGTRTGTGTGTRAGTRTGTGQVPAPGPAH